MYDDGSTDSTYDLAVSAGARVIRSPTNTGYGTAIGFISGSKGTECRYNDYP